MAGGIFICYRRSDTRHAAGRLMDGLRQTFDERQLFIDIDNIEPGLDFVEVLHDKVGRCDVLLALIGPNWLDARGDNGVRRIDDPDDFVRIEIEAALKRNVRVVPVLLDGAEMPKAADLPESLQPLLRRSAVQVRHERWHSDAASLIEALEKAVPGKSSWWRRSPRPNAPGKPVSAVAAMTEPSGAMSPLAGFVRKWDFIAIGAFWVASGAVLAPYAERIVATASRNTQPANLGVFVQAALILWAIVGLFFIGSAIRRRLRSGPPPPSAAAGLLSWNGWLWRFAVAVVVPLAVMAWGHQVFVVTSSGSVVERNGIRLRDAAGLFALAGAGYMNFLLLTAAIISLARRGRVG